jgi:hypothetical protein
LEIHTKTKVPGVALAGVQNMVDALLRINPRMAKLKADDLIDSSFIDWLGKKAVISRSDKKEPLAHRAHSDDLSVVEL